MILDYSSYTEEKSDELHEEFFQPLLAKIQTGFFKHNTEYCRFCNAKLKTPKKEVEDGGGGYDYVEIIFDCQNCGWWYYKNEEATYVGEGDTWHKYEYKFGILREYDVASKDVPIETLRKELSKRQELVYGLNPTKFEELVGSVFKDFYNCEVTHVGKSHDGGIDLLLARADTDTIIQVKRREKPNSTEGISVIRELIGVMTLAGKRDGIFVTTAAKFSKSAISATKKIKELGVVNKIELIDCSKFVDLMQLTSKSIKRPWEKLIFH